MMLPLRSWLYALLLALGGGLLPAGQVVAQPAVPRVVRRLSVADGLSDRKIHCLATDRAGYLWIGTARGLDRFDGYQIRSFAALTGRRLPAAPVQAVAEDAHGAFWIVTQAALLRYRPRAPGRPLRPVLTTPPATTPFVALWLAPNGHLWLAGGGGLLLEADTAGRLLHRWHLRQPTGKPYEFEAIRPLPGVGAGFLLEAFGGTVLHFAPTAGPQHRGGVVARYRDPTPDGEALVVARLPRRPTDTLWLASATTLLAVAPADSVPRAVAPLTRPDWATGPARPRYLLHSLPDAGGNLWLGAGASQLTRRDGRTGELTNLSDLLAPQYQVNVLLEDRARNLWLGTDFGLVQLENQPRRFNPLRPPESLWTPGRAFSTRGATLDEAGNFYVGSYAGLFRRRAADGCWERLDHFRDGKRVELFPYALLPAPDGRSLWIGSEGLGLVRYDLRTNRFETPDWNGDTTRDSRLRFVTALAPAADGSIWLGDYRELRAYDPRTRTFRLLPGPGPDALRYYALLPTPDGGAWAATSRGLLRLDGTGRATREWTVTAPGTAPDILALWPDPTGALWLGTRAAGLVRFDPRTNERRRWGTAEGLPDELVCSLVPAADSGLWIGTQRGLAYLPLPGTGAAGRVQAFFQADGLAHDEFNQGSAGRLPDGRVVLGGVAGLSVVENPAPAPPAGHPDAPVLLTSVSYLSGATGRITEDAWYAFDQPLTLTAADRLLTLHFALADFADAARHAYAYCLDDGLDDGADDHAINGRTGRVWIPLGTETTLHLTGLAPGTYTLRVRGAGPDGRWSRRPLRLALTVNPPWWRTPWFVTLVLALLGALIYALHRLRVRAAVRTARRVALQDERLRTRLAADLHDEVGSLLARVTMQAELLRELDPAPSGALTGLADDSRLAATTMRDIVWSVDARADSLAALVDRMRDHLDATARVANWQAELHTPGLDLTAALAPELRQHLYLIFKEAVTNAARHGRGTTTVTATLAPGRAGKPTLIVANDGAVVPAAGHPRATSGLGLRNMTQRATLLGLTLEAGPQPGGGWAVRVM